MRLAWLCFCVGVPLAFVGCGEDEEPQTSSSSTTSTGAGGGGGTGGSVSTGGTGQGGTGQGGTGQGGTGQGGGGNCFTCNGFFMECVGTNGCPDMSTVCPASQQVITDLFDCVCTDCSTDCAATCTSQGQDSQQCGGCLQTAVAGTCLNQAIACYGDA